MEKQEKLQLIWAAVRKAYPRQRLVFGDGSPDAKVMIIGEAPGKDEEREGRPFVGRAGRLLTGTLRELGWARSDFYITNIVKYRPADELGKNRTPTDEEIAKFRPAIEKEILVVDPRLIVLVGRVAMSGMGLAGSMGENRGRVLEWEPPSQRFGAPRKILITYHPAAILRNIHWAPQFKEDLSLIRTLVTP